MASGADFTVNDFQAEVIERSRTIPVLVDFWAEWCGPCKALGPILERLASKNNGRWVLGKVDTESHQDIAAAYGIQSIPNVKLFIDGEVADEFIGALPEPAIVRWLEKALPGLHDKILASAESLLAEHKTGEAKGILENVLASDARNERALILLAEVLRETDLPKAVALVEHIEEHSEYFPRADAIRTIAELLKKLDNRPPLEEDPCKQVYLDAIQALSARNYDLALDRFIDVIRKNRYYDDDGARKACVAVFRVLGDEHELTQKYRRAFSSALY